MEKDRAVTVVSASVCSQLARGPGWWEKSLPYVTSENCERRLAETRRKIIPPFLFSVFFTLPGHIFPKMERSSCENAADSFFFFLCSIQLRSTQKQKLFGIQGWGLYRFTKPLLIECLINACRILLELCPGRDILVASLHERWLVWMSLQP